MATAPRAGRVIWVLFALGFMALLVRPVHSLAADEMPQEVRGGGVAVRVTLLTEEARSLRFRIEMDTHMRDLDRYEFGEIVRVRDGSGKEFPPASIERLMGGGHHRVAILRFPPPESQAQAVELLVRDVAGVPERVFRWSLEGSGRRGRTPPTGSSQMK